MVRRSRRTARLGSLGALVASGGIAGGCLDATEILVEVRTDFFCRDLNKTSIAVGKPGESLDDEAPIIVTSRCDAATGRVGSTMVVPGENRSAKVGFRVVTGLRGRGPDECDALDTPGVDDALDDCIVQRRTLPFLEHTGLKLVIEMDEACAGIDCGPLDTCLEGTCVPAEIRNPEDCKGDNVCLPTRPPDTTPDAQSDVGPGAGGVDGGAGAAGSGGVTGGTGGMDASTGAVGGASGMAGGTLDASAGSAGTSGAAGMPGVGGTAGTSGVGGTAGTSGVGGTAGTSGLGGTAGTSGLGGTAGTSGVGGTAGTSGVGGTAGTSGVGGTAGTSGVGGTAGTSGVGGTAGTSGVGGTAGTSGVGGTAGTSGVGGTSMDAGADASAPIPPVGHNAPFGVPGAVDDSFDISVGPAGNYTIAGYYSGGSPSFGGAPLATGVGGFDVFVASYASNGAHVWSRGFGTSFNDQANGVAADAANDILVVGFHGGAINFGGSALPGPTLGQKALFVAKFSQAGAHQWSFGYGNGPFTQAWDVATDAAGNVYVVGGYEASLDFDPGPMGNHASLGSTDAFIVSYTSTGAFRWSSSFGNTLADEARSVAVDAAGNVYVAGYFRSVVDFGGGPKTASGSNSDVFVASYSSGGAHRWSEQFGGTGNDRARGIDVAASRVWVTGSFEVSTTFGPSMLSSNGLGDGFVAQLGAATGAAAWAKGFGAASDEWGDAVTDDGTGNVVVTGRSNGNVDFGGGLRTGPGSTDIFVASWSPGGAHRWSQIYGGPQGDIGEGIDVFGATGQLFVTGHISGPVDFGAGPIGSGTTFDVFVVRFDP